MLARELAEAPELWIQRGYLARVVTLGESTPFDDGIQPLEHFLDTDGGDAIAATIEHSPSGSHPVLYVRQSGSVEEVSLDPDPVDGFDAPAYERQLQLLLG